MLYVTELDLNQGKKKTTLLLYSSLYGNISVVDTLSKGPCHQIRIWKKVVLLERFRRVNTSGARGAELFKNNCKVSLQVATDFYSFEARNTGSI